MHLRNVSVLLVGLVTICWTDRSLAGTTTVSIGLTTAAATTNAAATTTDSITTGNAIATTTTQSYVTTATTATTASTANATTMAAAAATTAAAAAAADASNITTPKPVIWTSTAANAGGGGGGGGGEGAAGTTAVVSKAPFVPSNSTTVTPTTCWQAVVTAANSSGAVFNNVTNNCTSNSGICFVQYDTSSNTATFGCSGRSAYSTCAQNGITKAGNAANNVCEFCCVSSYCDDVARLSYDSAKTGCASFMAQLRNGADTQLRSSTASALLASVAAIAAGLLL